MGLPSTVL